LKNKSPFVVVTTQRSGSNFFEDCLNSHQEIHCRNEIFIQNRFSGELGEFYSFCSEKIKEQPRYLLPNERENLLKTYLGDIHNDGCISGFDLKYGQEAVSNQFWDILVQMNYKAIQLIRANILESLISQYTLSAYNREGTRGGVKIPVEQQLVDLLDKRFATIYQYTALLKGVFQKQFMITFYEELLGMQDSKSHISSDLAIKIQNFLGCENIKALETQQYRKKRGVAIEQQVVNSDSVLSTLKNSRWNFLLEDKRTVFEEFKNMLPQKQQYAYRNFSVWEYDRFIDVAKRAQNLGKKVVIYGAGECSRKLLAVVDRSEMNVCGIVDRNYSKIDACCGYSVTDPIHYNYASVDSVILATEDIAFKYEIIQQLLSLGCDRARIITIDPVSV